MDVKSLYELLHNANPIITMALLGCVIYLIKRVLAFKTKEYNGIFETLQQISQDIAYIKKDMERNNEYTKKLYAETIKEKVAQLRKEFAEHGTVPTQGDVDKLYSQWRTIEDLGDGYQEIKSSIDKVREIMYV